MFSAPERRAVYRVIAERRDMRRFVPGGVVSEDVLARLLHAAHAAPSVGLMQPWRFIRITDETLKRRIHALVDDERLLTAEALGAREEEFLALKVEGILDCAELLVVGAVRPQRVLHLRPAHPAPDGSGVGVVRHPKPVAGSAVRRPGHGMGVAVRPTTFSGPAGDARRRRTGGHLVPGAGARVFRNRPALELDGWAYARPLAEFVSENRWSYPSALATDHHHGE
ncbi:oxidoreductase [Mycobacterium tuberculosis RGTB327]|nr:oxidoreductase [Mycobacterium tuberculosis RGTB327]